MNKKGFTLVELLAVIVVLALIIGVATTSSITISNRSKKKMYNSKVDMILGAAVIYAQDHLTDFSADKLPKEVKVSQLNAEGYLKKDDDSGKINNPVSNESMAEYKVIIKKANNRFAAKINCSNGNGSTWNKNDVLNDDIKTKYCE